MSVRIAPMRRSRTFGERLESLERRRPTPVLMVAMMAAFRRVVPAVSRRQARERDDDGADVHRSQARSQVFRKNSGSRGDAEPHRGSEGVLRPVPAGRRRRTAGGPTRACRRCSSRCSRSRISPTPRMLEFVSYEFEPPKYDVDECRQRGMTYAAPLKVTLRLIVFDVDEETGAKSVKDIKEQDVYMGDIPLMTDERHLRRQRHRARHRLADAPFARRVLRSRQGQDAFLGQAAVRRPHHSVSRLVARHRVRRQGHRACAHRPPPQDSGDVAALCARPGRRGNPRRPSTRSSPTSAPRTAGACRSMPTA